MWLFIRRFKDLDEKEREELATIRQASETAETLYQLVQQFLQMVRTLEGERLDAWLTAVAQSQIAELQRFANGLEQDKAAVLMGLTHSPNNAQAEGQVTRIKRDFENDVWTRWISLVAAARFAPLLRTGRAQQASYADMESF